MSDDDDIEDDDEEIELLVEEGQVPVILQRRQHKATTKNEPVVDLYLDDEDEDSVSNNRDSFPLGAGCLPCTPKSSKKVLHKCKIHGKSSNWCCGVVATTVKKTAKKL